MAVDMEVNAYVTVTRLQPFRPVFVRIDDAGDDRIDDVTNGPDADAEISCGLNV